MAFAYYDKTRSGKVTTEDLPHLIRALGRAPSQVQVKAMQDEVGKNDFDYATFLTLMTRPLPSPTFDQILEALKVFDKEGNGIIPEVEFRHTMTYLGEKFRDSEVDEMLREAEVDGDGNVFYENFVKNMMRK
jgi:calmodulin